MALSNWFIRVRAGTHLSFSCTTPLRILVSSQTIYGHRQQFLREKKAWKSWHK
ncbi:hypothetical protein VFPPC_18118 [Pochonia chlamydosporia 170]|uniref:Uncharacterized protein n=1 Tax=Pochonia chlamydosporia 170 TaxID=1380566 RepID=A0A219ARA2_METCM|nr:hypothetical protein VFPPC_18118 [Pochonia chlamydosporia 170]OWT42705.1 hypothetical protein VFPPC_18118 [Pochonia chlamydosporia 170]